MTGKEQDKRRHENKMPKAGSVIIAEYRCCPVELHRPVDRDAAEDCTESGKGNCGIRGLLKRIIFFRGGMLFLDAQIIFDHGDKAAEIVFVKNRRLLPVL